MYSWLDRMEQRPVATRDPLDEFSVPLRSGGLGSLIESTHHAYEEHNHGRYNTRAATKMVGARRIDADNSIDD